MREYTYQYNVLKALDRELFKIVCKTEMSLGCFTDVLVYVNGHQPLYFQTREAAESFIVNHLPASEPKQEWEGSGK